MWRTDAEFGSVRYGYGAPQKPVARGLCNSGESGEICLLADGPRQITTRRRRLWPLRGRKGAEAPPAPISEACTEPAVAGATDLSSRPALEATAQSLPPLLLTSPVAPPHARPSQATPSPSPAPQMAQMVPPPQTRAETIVPGPEDATPYLAHFNLSKRPFSLLPDPDFLFWSPTHQRAYAMLEYGLMSHAPLTMVTGAIGAGKTTLVHHLLRGLGSDVRVGLISNASDLRGELLYWVRAALGESTDRGADPAAVFEAFQQSLIDTYASGRRVVLIFDEAQTLGRERLEELRMLTNINTGSDVLLQIVLVGQPDLLDTLRRPDMEQFVQRIAASFHLPALTAETQAQYIAHRLQVAGAERVIFDPDALALVHKATRGVPRLTNQICDLSMLYAYSADKSVVDAACVQHVIDDNVLPGAWASQDAQPSVGHPAHSAE